MDQITSSDKFKQLRSNISSTNRIKVSDINNKQKLNTNVAGISVIRSHNHTTRSSSIRGSPRRFQHPKIFDLRNIHCSFKTKSKPVEIHNSDQNHINGLGISKNFENQRRGDEAVTTTDKTKSLFLEKPERDSAGFLKPLHPAPRKNVYASFVEEELKTFNELMQRLTNDKIFHEVEIAYHIEKLFNNCKQTAFKLSKKQNSTLPLTQNMSSSNRIQSWLHTSQATEPSKVTDLRMDNLDKSSKVLSRLNENTVNNSEPSQRMTAYILKDWSVIKGHGKTDLMVSGILIDFRSRKILEQNHRSSCIIERSESNFVKTICCSYRLCGNFVAGEEGAPTELIKYFKDGEFPENWRAIASRWHSLNLNKAVTLENSKPCDRNSTKRCREDATNNVIDESIKAKKIKPNYIEICHARGGKSRELAGASSQNSSRMNTSVQTRSAMRKIRGNVK